MSDEINDLINSLDSSDKKIRRESIKKLKEAGKKGAVPLLKALDSSSVQVRSAAAGILGTYSKDSIQTFLKLIISGSENTRDGAAMTVGQIAANGTPVTGYISDMISDKDYRLRKGAAFALGSIGRYEKNTTNMLLYLLKDENPEVRWQAAASLDKINWKSENQTDKAYYYLVKEEWGLLGKSGSFSIPALGFGIEVSGNENKKEIARILSKIDGDSSNSLLKLLLDDSDPEVRQTAVAAAADKGDSSLQPFLVKSLDDSDRDVRTEAAWSLEKTGWKPKNYHEKTKSLMLRGSYAEVERMGEYAIPCLIEFLGDDLSEVRENTCIILSHLGEPGMNAVKCALKSSVPEIKKGASEAIKFIRNEEIKNQEKKTEDFLNNSNNNFKLNSSEYWMEKMLLSDFGNDISQTFSKSLANEDPVVRIVAIEGLKKFGKTSSEVLLQLTEDENENVQVAAIEALGDIYEKKALSCLSEKIEDDNKNVRRACAYSLGKIRETAAIPVLIRHFSDTDENVRNESSGAVAKMGNPAIPFIENMIFHSNELVRISSLNAIGEISDPLGIPLAIRSLNDPDFDVRSKAMDALFKMSNFMFNYLMHEVHRVGIQGTKMEKLGILSVLSRTGDMKILPFVREYLNDEDEEVRRNVRIILDIFTQKEIKKKKEKIREYSRETASLLRRKLTLKDIDLLLDRVLNADDADALDILKNKLSQKEIDELVRSSVRVKKRDTAKILGKKLTQDEIDELLHRSVYVENKNTTKLLGKKLNQDEIDDLIHRADTKKDETAAKDIKKQLTQNEIDSIIKKEIELKKKIAMEVSRLVVGLKSDDSKTRENYTERIVRMGEPAVEPLITTMTNADPEFQDTIADVLVRIGKPGIRGLIRILNYGKPGMKILSAEKISKSKDKEAYDALYDRIFSEKNPDVKKVLVELFGGLSDKRVIDAAAYAIKDKNPNVRLAAVKILGRQKDERAIDLLISCFEDPNQTICNMAVSSLKTHGKNVRKPLLSALRSDKNDLYKKTAALTLEKTGGIPKDKEDLVYFNIAADRWEEVVKAGDVAVLPVFDVLKNPFSGKRKDALICLTKINTEKPVYPLSYMLFDMDGELSEMAGNALIDRGTGVLAALKTIASKNEDDSQKEVLFKLISDIEKNEAIKQYISEERWDELIRCGPCAIDFLAQILSDRNNEKRIYAADAIGRIGTEESIIPLADALSDPDKKVAATAGVYLKKIGKDDVRYLLKLKENIKDTNVQNALDTVIEEIEQRERIKSFIVSKKWDALKDEGLPALDALGALQRSRNAEKRLLATTVMADMDMPESVPKLVKAFFDPDSRVSDAARKGLLMQGDKSASVLKHMEKITENPQKKDAVRKLLDDLKKPDANRQP